MKLERLDLTRQELQDMLVIAHEAMTVCSDHAMHELLLRIRELVPCDKIIAFLGETSSQGELMGVVKLVNVNYPAEWAGVYLENGYATVDPVLRAHFRQFKPQLWSETYRNATSARERMFIDHAASYQLYEGVTLGQHSNRSALGSLFSFAGSDMGEHSRHRDVLGYLVPHMHIAMMRTAFSVSDRGSLLSAREREVLHWMMKGKTNWETSRILNISERTVKFHVCNILAKLHSSTRGQAIAHALEQGLADRPLSSLETWLASVCSGIENFPNLGSPQPTPRRLVEAL